MLPLVAGATALIALAWRTRYLRAVERRSMRGRTLGSDGVVVGGEGFDLRRANAPAILVLHGAGDTPQTVRYLADFLYARGFAVSAPLLPGHGRTIREFANVSADALMNSASAHYGELRAAHGWVGVVGVSMGGALAVQLAAETPDLPALVLISPYLEMPRSVARAARWARVWGPVVPFVSSTDGLSILDPAERERNLAYGAFAARALFALYTTVRRGASRLPKVAAPTLMIQSREDNRISVDAGTRAFAALGSADKRLEWLTGAAHVVTVDYGRERVFELVDDWMRAHQTASATTQ
jgi:carboxylesterase